MRAETFFVGFFAIAGVWPYIPTARHALQAQPPTPAGCAVNYAVQAQLQALCPVPSCAQSPPVNTQNGTAYTLQPGDNGAALVFTSASPVTVTVPSGLGQGFSVQLIQMSIGVVTPTATSGVLIHQRLKLTKTAGQYAWIELFAPSPDSFVLSGDLQ